MTRVFVDTNVLFPFSLMDLFLALSEDAVHEIMWTDALLAEWERVIVREQRRSADQAAAIVADIKSFFPENEVPESAYADLVDLMPGSDPDDRHHMAAAVAAGASHIITWNRSDFPSRALAQYGIQVTSPDDYLCDLIVDVPSEVVDAVERIARGKSRPPMTPYDLVERYSTAGAPNFAARLKDRIDARRAITRRTVSRRFLGRPTQPIIEPMEVSQFFSARRPPRYWDVQVRVAPHTPTGYAAHSAVLNVLLLELLTAWPLGTALVVSYRSTPDKYTQALAYAPTLETEIGRLTEAQMNLAVDFGWMNPTVIARPHGDFESQAVWADNPVREWQHPFDSTPEIAAFMASSVSRILDVNPGDGYHIRMLNNYGRRRVTRRRAK
ncbi:PIN domain-containing protein [Dactylosporangium sucinum]|uniref:PIN domain-containing protein n=1 Tax=Dactylosporangium sucinum TaxID=1424081 RepID=A0A917TMF9_9ACTN|nr:PIN domain-containing protein [Dactylosporangium sucinum]GGM27754.1 hypothetical protein GCM10007977_031270 [Dactylosporangium sucinum]